MTPWPLAARELNAWSQRPLTRRLRLGAVLIAAGIVVLCFAMTSASPLDMASAIFWGVSWLLFAWCAVAGAVLTADCLSRERRLGTLGLLFLSNLNGVDVVLGKAAAAVAQSFSVTVAVLPVLALPLLLGSLTWGQFVRMAVALVVTQVWSLAIGTWVSSGHHDGRKAVLTTLAVVGSILVGPYLAAQLTGAVGQPGLADIFRIVSPLALAFAAAEGVWATGVGAVAFIRSLWVVSATALISLMLASWRLQRTWNREAPDSFRRAGDGGGVSGKSNRMQSEAPLDDQAAAPYTNEQVRVASVRRVRFQRSPYESIARSGAHVPWGFRCLLILVGCLWLGQVMKAVARGPGSDRAVFSVLFLCFALHVLVKVATAVIAAQRPSEDTAGGAMELLLTTPLQPGKIRLGHLDAMRGLMFITRLILTWVNVASAVVFAYGSTATMEDWLPFVIAFIAGIPCLWLDTRLIAELALICGVRRRQQTRAALEATAMVLVPGWVGMVTAFLLIVGGINGGMKHTLVFVLGALWCLGTTWLQLRSCHHLGNVAFGELTAGWSRFPDRPRHGQIGQRRDPLPSALA